MLSRYFYTCILALSFTIMWGQINITSTGKSGILNSDGEEEFTFEDEDSNLENKAFIPIKKAFKTFKLKEIEDHFVSALKDDLDSIINRLEMYEKWFNESNNVNFYENTTRGMTSYGAHVGFVEFKSDKNTIGTLEIEYEHRNRAPYNIYKITIIHSGRIKGVFPSIFNRIDAILRKKKNLANSEEYQTKIKLNTELIELAEKSKVYKEVNQEYLTDLISKSHGSNSFYYCLINNPDSALQSAKEGLQVSPHEEWIKTNIGLAYAIKGEFEKAKKEYLLLKDKKSSNGSPFKDSIIEDLELINSLGIHVEKYNELLQLLKG